MAKPFLQLLAEAYLNQRDLKDYCFVFPNRRAGTFFRERLISLATSRIILPEITTITDFVAEVTNSVEISQVEALFVLYDAYQNVCDNPNFTFDRFAFFGEIILRDFSDIDRYMADAERVYSNTADIKEIKSNYLTEEQIEVLSKYFNLPDNLLQSQGTDEFWKHLTPGNEHDSKAKYLSFWNILYPLYKEYNKLISEMGLSYSGKMYREAVKIIENTGGDNFPHKRYIFAGFNALSTSEYHIFNKMKNKGIANFHWDKNSPAFDRPNNRANDFITRNIAAFPETVSLNEEKITTFPNIHVIGVPSRVGQAKYAAQLVTRLAKDGIIQDIQNATDTAIVLPEESLYLPLVDSIKPEFEKINLTMGSSLRGSGIVSLMNSITRMHRMARHTKEEEWMYLYEDVKDVLAHPIIKTFAGKEVLQLVTYINNNNLVRIPASKIKEKAVMLRKIFEPISNVADIDQITGFVENISHFIMTLTDFDNTISEKEKDNEKNTKPKTLDHTFADIYIESLQNLVEIIKRHNAILNEDTFFFILRSILSNIQVSFEGMPLEGLQIMGTLETRCLDFKNIIILSMNEHIFPKKHYTRSFIPTNLRRSFGMSTIDHQEAMISYYFYRMISRAENAYLIYDSRNPIQSEGERSRFITQLERIYNPKNLKKIALNSPINPPSDFVIKVKKTDRIINKLKVYTTPESGKYLSASALKHYIACPLRFYFEKVEGLGEISELNEFLTAAEIGTVMHDTLYTLYTSAPKNPSTQKPIISKDYIDSLMKSGNNKLRETITEELHKTFRNSDQQPGQFDIFYLAIYEYIKKVLLFDKKLIEEKGNLTLEEAENEHKMTLKLGDHTINFKMFIDRADSYIDTDNKKTTRIVDYKTGSDATKFTDVEDLFNSDPTKNRLAIFQVLLYCIAYKKLKDEETRNKTQEETTIMPYIFKTSNLKESGITFNKKSLERFDVELNDGSNLADEFCRRVGNIINEMFDQNVDFEQTPHKDNCSYCQFKGLCRRD